MDHKNVTQLNYKKIKVLGCFEQLFKQPLPLLPGLKRQRRYIDLEPGKFQSEQGGQNIFTFLN